MERAQARSARRAPPSRRIEGFLRQAGERSINSRSARTRRAVLVRSGAKRAAAARPPKSLPSCLPRRSASFPGRNRCAGAAASMRWVRPLHAHARALFDGAAVARARRGLSSAQPPAATASWRRSRSRCATSPTTNDKLREARVMLDPQSGESGSSREGRTLACADAGLSAAPRIPVCSTRWLASSNGRWC